MRIRAVVLAAAAVALAPVPPGALAQEPVPATLSLEDALQIARRNNPAYLQTLNDEELADWDVRQAWGQLYLPSANVSTTYGWQGPGNQQFGSITLDDLGFGQQPAILSSSYNLGVSYNLTLSSLLAPSQAKAQRRAAEAGSRAAETTLVSQVTTAYLEVLRQTEGVRLAEQELENARFNLRLAQGQLEVGQATPIDVGQAEVQVGRAEVALLQARNAEETGKMRLLQQLGVPVDRDVALESAFALTEPAWEVGELHGRALDANPELDRTRRSHEAAGISVRQAQSSYLPSMQISTGVSGFTREQSNTDIDVARAQAQVAGQVQQCVQTNELFRRLADPLPPQDCGRFRFTDDQRRAIVDQNDQFPFNFQRNPIGVQVSLSVPIFQGFSRERDVEAARVQRDDLAQQIREREIALRADIAVGLADVRTAYESARLEERNRDLAEQQLRLARERYRLGAITFVELVDAQTVLAQAERDRTAAIFSYHDALTQLEALVGTPLRN